MSPAPDVVRHWHPRTPVDVARTLGAMAKGPYDPAQALAADGSVWRASRMRSGPVTYRARSVGADVVVEAWGAGAAELADEVPVLLGRDDDWSGFDAQIPVVARALQRHPGLRIVRNRQIFESLVPAVIEQRVPGVDAYASWRRLLRQLGEPAPGPAPRPLTVPPSPETWRTVPSWVWHRAGVDPARSATIMRAVQRTSALERLAGGPVAAVAAGLQSIPGIGVWTAAEVTRRLGDPDAVSVGDYNLAKDVCTAFDGTPGDDARMLEILEPWRGHRARVIALLYADGALRRERHGPRITRMDHRTR